METRFAHIPPVTLAYIAGLVDGEGTITIRRANRGKGRRSEEYAAQLSIVQKDRTILDWIKSELGCGTVVEHHFKGDRWGSPIMHHWGCGTAMAYEAVKALRPYLRIKHRQADLLMEFQELKQTWMGRVSKGFRGAFRTPPEYIEKYRAFCVAVQTLNGRRVVNLGPRNADAEPAGVLGAQLTCSACEGTFISDTYFGVADLSRQKHYCKACREGGYALRHQKQVNGAKYYLKRKPSGIRGICPDCGANVGTYVPTGGDGSLRYGMPHGKNRACGGPSAGEVAW